jgi:hypothetical protein
VKVWLGAHFVGAMLLAVVAVPPAAAKPGPNQQGGVEVQKRSLRLKIPLEGSNGYRGFIVTTGHRRVKLELGKGRAEFVATASGRVDRGGIEADFGELGNVSIRFEGERVPWPGPLADLLGLLPRRECRGRKPVFEAGKFRGTVRFEGENGFTEIDVGTVPGTVERHYRRVCQGQGIGGQTVTNAATEKILGRLKVTLLRAVAHRNGATISFQAAISNLGSLLGLDDEEPMHTFVASSVERKEGVRIVRSISGTGKKGSFAASDEKANPRTATVSPPQPFAGSATYLEPEGEPASWTGTLTVPLPGVAPLELAGPEFKSMLCHTNLGALLKGGCDPEAGRLVPAPRPGGAAAWALPLPIPDDIRLHG